MRAPEISYIKGSCNGNGNGMLPNDMFTTATAHSHAALEKWSGGISTRSVKERLVMQARLIKQVSRVLIKMVKTA